MHILTHQSVGLDKMLFISPFFTTVATMTLEQQIDEYGFLKKNTNVPYWKAKVRSLGRGHKCHDLCRNIKKCDSRKVSYMKTQDYYCVSCSIAMKCVRCRCCGRIGRREPRQRNRMARLVKYIT